MKQSDFGTDLRVQRPNEFGYSVDLALQRADLATVSGWENLAQALWLRLNTPMGELAPLGHPEYGSRLYLIVGRLLNKQTLLLAQAYVREALEREERIAFILAVDATPKGTDSLLVQVQLQAAAMSEPMQVALTIPLEPGQGEAVIDAAAR